MGDPLPQHPTVVLINRDTASAAEILASALGDHRLATIVGTRSFGKGTFQEVIHLSAGGALDLTVGQYFTRERNLAGRQGDHARGQGRRRSGDAAGRGPAPRAGGAGREDGRREPVSPAGAAGRWAGAWRPSSAAAASRVAEPLFERGPQVALARGSIDVGPGEIALVDFGPARRPGHARARLAESARDVVAALLWDRGMDRGFAAALESEAADAAAAAREAPLARRDSTHLPTFTVDPATRARLRRRRLGRGRRGRRAALDPHRRRGGPCAARRRPRLRGASPRHQHIRAGDAWSRCFPRRSAMRPAALRPGSSGSP